MTPSISLSYVLHLQSIQAERSRQILYYASVRAFVVVGVLNISDFLMNIRYLHLQDFWK